MAPCLPYFDNLQYPSSREWSSFSDLMDFVETVLKELCIPYDLVGSISNISRTWNSIFEKVLLNL